MEEFKLKLYEINAQIQALAEMLLKDNNINFRKD